MKRKITFLILISAFFLNGCQNKKEGPFKQFKINSAESYNVKNQIKDITTEKYYRNPFIYIVDKFLIILDFNDSDKGIHFYVKNSFEYVTNTGFRGRGPGEINNLGTIAFNKQKRDLWVADYSKRVRWKFPLDSILNNKHFKPDSSLKINYKLFLDSFDFLNDSIAIGKAVHAINHNAFNMSMAKLNLNNNETERFGYEHPKTKGNLSNSKFELSPDKSTYVNAFAFCDLMTICDIQGEVKCNIYGPNWNQKQEKKQKYYAQVDFIGKHIIASYVGENAFVYDKHERPKSNLASKLLVFDVSGNHIKTIETGHKLSNFCVDQENKRVICYFVDRDNPLGYFNLNIN